MTEQKMTDAEAVALNEKCARAMGWVFDPSLDQSAEDAWIRPGSEEKGAGLWARYIYRLPDFARDPMAIGWLVAWCCQHEGAYRFPCWSVATNPMSRYDAFVDDDDVQFWGGGDSPGEAICKAIIAYAEAGETEKGK